MENNEKVDDGYESSDEYKEKDYSKHLISLIYKRKFVTSLIILN